MAINSATLSKKINGSYEYIYPKTNADLVNYGANSTVAAEITALNTNTTNNATAIAALKNITTVSSLAEMINTSAYYIYNFRIYHYDTATSSWTALGDLPGVVTDTTLAVSGAAADSATVGTGVSALDTRITTLESYVSEPVEDTIEDYISTDITETGTVVPTNLTVKTYVDAIGNRVSMLENASGSFVPATSEYNFAFLDSNDNILMGIDTNGDVNITGNIISPTIDELWNAIYSLGYTDN